MLADDVKLHQSLHPLRVGRADVGLFFTLYAKIDGVSLVPAWLEGREVIAVFEDRADPKPSYIMWLEWRDGRIRFIHDYRYVRYVTADAELTLAPEAEARGRRRRSVMPGAVLPGPACARQCASSSMAGPRASAVLPQKDARPVRVLGAAAEARDGRGEGGSVAGRTMSAASQPDTTASLETISPASLSPLSSSRGLDPFLYLALLWHFQLSCLRICRRQCGHR